MRLLKTALLIALVVAAGLTSTACKKKAAPAAEEQVTQQVDDAAAKAAAEEATRLEAERAAAAAEAERLAAAERAKAESERLARESRANTINALNPVYFDFDKFELREDTRATLARHGDALRTVGDLRLKLEGHCDERGSVGYNLALGDKRANSVKGYFKNMGLDGARFETISYGKSQPVDPGHDESAWSKNRRVEFKALNP